MALFKKKTEKPSKAIRNEDKKEAAVEKVQEMRNPKEKRIDLAWRVLKHGHITEKATDALAFNKYIFNVYPERNKKEIKAAVENIYGVDVISVNVVNIPQKRRRLGKTAGWKSGYKKAIVQIKSGQKIELMPR